MGFDKTLLNCNYYLYFDEVTMKKLNGIQVDDWLRSLNREIACIGITIDYSGD